MAAAHDLARLDLHPAGLNGVNAHDDRSVLPDAAAMGVAELLTIFETVAEHAVHADVEPDQADRRGDGRADAKAPTANGSANA